MSPKLDRFTLAPEEIENLRSELLKFENEVIPVLKHPRFSSLVIALGIHQEIGTIHDELSKFLFDGATGKRVSRKRMSSELVRYHNTIGVRIWVERCRDLDPRVQGMRELIHPELSRDAEGRIHSLYFFPTAISKIAALKGAELVLMRPWAINTIFGGFDSSKPYYEANFWELVNLDARRYARLLAAKQIPFLGTHDVVSHISGINPEGVLRLASLGREVNELLIEYFAGIERPKPYSLVLPYALGLLIDDLAQPMNYEHSGRMHVVRILMEAIRTRAIDPRKERVLLKYPPAYERLIELARAAHPDEAKKRGRGLVQELIAGLNEYSIVS